MNFMHLAVAFIPVLYFVGIAIGDFIIGFNGYGVLSLVNAIFPLIPWIYVMRGKFAQCSLIAVLALFFLVGSLFSFLLAWIRTGDK